MPDPLPIKVIKNDEENPRLFISTIDISTYEYVSSLINANIFKYFNTIYANDSFRLIRSIIYYLMLLKTLIILQQLRLKKDIISI